MKVVINNCHGGFGLSAKALMEYAKRKGMTLYFYGNLVGEHFDTLRQLTPDERDKYWYGTCLTTDLGQTVERSEVYNEKYKDAHFSVYDIKRNDPDLVAVVESMGEKASDEYSQLKIIEIPDDVEFEIMDYDGHEWVAEKHRTWS